jgi:N-acetylmuramate 1-kinase
MHPAPNNQRYDALSNWLSNDLNLSISNLEYASDDASFRRYYRVTHSGGQHIVMDAPPDKENTEPFIRVADLLQQATVHVPVIYQKNLKEGFLLLEDFGNDSFLDKLNPGTADSLYQSAFDSLFRLQSQLPATQTNLPRYDHALLDRELTIFYEWFLRNWLDIEIPTAIRETLNAVLTESALSQPQVCVHRDFHSRNLMVLKHNSPGVIDFQDAVIGPITYDLVSLLRDCYICWPQTQVEQWMQSYFQRLHQAELITTDLNTFRRWFDLMGMQRHLKAIGIFSRLNLRDQKPSYLQDIPRTLNYVTSVCQHYPELKSFNQYMFTVIMPKFQLKL